MKKITEEELDLAALKHIGLGMNTFKAGGKWAADKLQQHWKPISQYPMDKKPLVMRFHKLWKVPVSVFYYPDGGALPSCKWIDGTRSNSWPEEAFEPSFCTDLPSPF